MTTSAWWMLGITWTVITVITARLFWKVLSSQGKKPSDD